MQIFNYFCFVFDCILCLFMEENIILDCQKLCKKILGVNFSEIIPLKISGSARRYYRIFIDGSSYIYCFSENKKENETFLRLSVFFKDKGLKVPEILGTEADLKSYILEDLGDTDLLSIIKESRDKLNELIGHTFRELVKFQRLPIEEWKELVEFQPFDGSLIQYDFNYCRENFFKASGLTFNEEKLDSDFKRLEGILLSYPKELWGLMYRDFQSRNIMVRDEEPYLIDYQSCRYGPGIYDLVSFAWQAKARFTNEERSDIGTLYCTEMERRGVPCLKKVLENVPFWAVFRILQTLGAYGLRGLKEGKPHFIESIPYAVHNIKELFERHGLEQIFPTLAEIIEKTSREYQV